MPRFIDADKAIARVKASPILQNICLDGYFVRGAICDLLDNMARANASKNCPRCGAEQKGGE